MNFSGSVSGAENREPLQGSFLSPRLLEFPSLGHKPRFMALADRCPWAVCLVLAAAALAIRLAVMPFLYQENLNPERDHWMFGHEQGRVARSIALNRGFANPLFGRTGPTAYPAPIYPYFMAAAFKIFGIYSRASAIVIVAVNCLFSAATVIPLYFYARRSFGRRAALLAGLLWVVFPYSIYWTILRIWDTWLSTLLLSILFLLALKLADSDALLQWAGFGLLWGFMGLVNPVALAVLPGLGLWMTYSLHRQGKRWPLPAATAVLCDGHGAVDGPKLRHFPHVHSCSRQRWVGTLRWERRERCASLRPPIWPLEEFRRMESLSANGRGRIFRRQRQERGGVHQSSSDVVCLAVDSPLRECVD